MTATLYTYEFINPSDGIHFDASSDEVAACAALVVGGGQCGAKRIDNGESVIGIALFGGDGGFEATYGRRLDIALPALIDEVIAACHSFRLRSGNRTSLSDWCAFAHGMKKAESAE